MKMSRKKLLIIAGSVCFVLAVILSLSSREPTYQGRRVSLWLEDYSQHWVGSKRGEPAKVALQHLGTNAIPVMLRWIQYEPPRYWRDNTKVWVRALKKLPFLSRSIERKQLRAAGALYAFQDMGPRADCAVPELNRIVLNLKSNQVQRPLVALTYLGTNAIPAMIAALTNNNLNNRSVVTEAFFGLGPAAYPALPVLLECMNDSDPAVRMGCCNALGRMRANPVRVIPPLMQAVSDPHPDVRYRALVALSCYGTNARPAAPAVLKALNDPVANVHNWATNTLRLIAPEMLRQADP